jgi:hypothetical protein
MGDPLGDVVGVAVGVRVGIGDQVEVTKLGVTKVVRESGTAGVVERFGVAIAGVR